MKLGNTDPFVRYADKTSYKSEAKPVYCLDCRIVYVHRGAGELILDGQRHALSEGSLFYCNAGNCYSVSTHSKDMTIYAVNFDLTQSNSDRTTIYPLVADKLFSSNLLFNLQDIDDSKAINGCFFLRDATVFFSPISEIVNEFSKQGFCFREKAGSILKQLLIDLHRADIEKPQNSTYTVHQLVKFIEKNYTRELSNKELAALAGYHEFHLNRLFLKQTGVGMHKYILNLRLEEAKRLIINTNMPISAISDKVGFNRDTHFSSYFKKRFGLTPTEFRRELKDKV